MEWLLVIPMAVIMFLWCCLIVSGHCSEDEDDQHKEETYRSLDPKSLDDDILLDKFMEEDILNYEEENREIEDESKE